MDRETQKILNRYPPKPRRQKANHRRTMATRRRPSAPRDETTIEAALTLCAAVIALAPWLVFGYRVAQLFGG